MKRKSGLHKKVSSIFGDTSLPKDKSDRSPLAENTAGADLSSLDSGSRIADKKSLNYTPGIGRRLQPAARGGGAALTEDEEYAASQRKKLYFMLVLIVILALILFFNFYKPGPGNTASGPKSVPIPNKIDKNIAINWPQPELWPENIRDPMAIAEDATIPRPGGRTPGEVEGALVLKGLVYKPGGGSTALIGERIVSEGDEIEGWTVKKIARDSVLLEKPDGEKQNLKWKTDK